MIKFIEKLSFALNLVCDFLHSNMYWQYKLGKMTFLEAVDFFFKEEKYRLDKDIKELKKNTRSFYDRFYSLDMECNGIRNDIIKAEENIIKLEKEKERLKAKLTF